MIDYSFDQAVTKLRNQAEAQIHQTLSKQNIDPYSMDEIMYELQIHQTELELQYEELKRTNNKLQQLYQEYFNLYEFAPCGYITLDEKEQITHINQAAINLLGINAFPNTPFCLSEFIASEYQSFFSNALLEASQALKKPSVDVEIICPDQSRIWVHLDIEAILTRTNEVQQWRIALSDISAQKKAEQVQKEQERLQLVQQQAQREQLLNTITFAIRQTLDLETIAEQTVTKVLEAFSISQVTLQIYDESTKEIELIQRACKNELADQETLPTSIGDYFQAQQWFQNSEIISVTDIEAERKLNPILEYLADSNIQSILVASIFDHETLQGVLTLQTCEHIHHWTQSEQQLLKQISNQLGIALQQARLYQQLQNELAERTRLQQALRHQAIHDQLTGLPNRNLLLDRLEKVLQRYQPDQQYCFAVLFLDLNDFQSVNNNFGHTVGDQLLVNVSQRLQTHLQQEDTIARVGGDEFVIILEDLKDQQEGIDVAHRIHQALTLPICINGISLKISTSIGIVFDHREYTNPDTLLRDADIAMYQSKRQGSNYVIFNG